METFFSYGFTDLKFGSGFTAARKSGYTAEAGAGVSVTPMPPRNAAAVTARIAFFMVRSPNGLVELALCLSLDRGTVSLKADSAGWNAFD